MSTVDLEKTLSEANAQIGAFLSSDHPALAPLFLVLADVAAFLPVENPTPKQTAALKQYRKNLEQLQGGIESLTGRLWSVRASLQGQRNKVKAALAYQRGRSF